MSASQSVLLILVGVLVQFAGAQSTERVSVGPGNVQGNGPSFWSGLSGDGRFVVYASYASNLVPGDTNTNLDVFVRDRQAATTSRVSVSSSGTEANGDCVTPVISSDGRWIGFASSASNLVAGDTNGAGDVFVRDRINGLTERASIPAGGGQGDSSSSCVALSADGRFVAFESLATNMVAGDTNARLDVFVRDRQAATTERVSVSSSGAQGSSDSYGPLSLSADGRFVAFTSAAGNLVPNNPFGIDNVLLRDRLNGTTELVSLTSSGGMGDSGSSEPSLSADGRFVTFMSWASNMVANDLNNYRDAFVRDRLLGTTEIVSVATSGAQSDFDVDFPALSADGRFISFCSDSTTLVPGDTNGGVDVFVRDLVVHSTERCSVTTAGAEAQGWLHGFMPTAVSADGRYVAFSSHAGDLVPGDTNLALDVFVRDRGPVVAHAYCTAGTTTHGCTPSMSSSGLPRLGATSGFTLLVSSVEGVRTGIVFYGVGGALALPWASGSSSYLCVKPPTQRTAPQNSGGTLNACDGAFAVDLMTFLAAHPSALGQPLYAGERLDAQAWFRDPPAPKTTNMSDALEFFIYP